MTPTETNHCPSLKGIISEGKCSEAYSGLGSKIYIGVKNEDGSMPNITDMQPVNLVDSNINAEEDDKKECKKGWSSSFSASFEVKDDGRLQSEKDMVEFAIKFGKTYYKEVMRDIKHMRCRRRKTSLRRLLSWLCFEVRNFKTYMYVIFPFVQDAIALFEHWIVIVRMTMGKAVVMYDYSGEDLKVKMRKKGNKFETEYITLQ